jgi:GNAT superfamily N-acetyltransferase
MITQLTVEQVPLAVEFGPLFWAEGKLPGSFVPAKFVGTWKRATANGSGGILGQWSEGKLVGILGFFMWPDINDGELVATEAFWYVKEGHRGNGVRLLLDYEKLARERGCKRIGMVHLSALKADKLSALYERMGYVPTETHFFKEL